MEIEEGGVASEPLYLPQGLENLNGRQFPADEGVLAGVEEGGEDLARHFRRNHQHKPNPAVEGAAHFSVGHTPRLL